MSRQRHILHYFLLIGVGGVVFTSKTGDVKYYRQDTDATCKVIGEGTVVDTSKFRPLPIDSRQRVAQSGSCCGDGLHCSGDFIFGGVVDISVEGSSGGTSVSAAPAVEGPHVPTAFAETRVPTSSKSRPQRRTVACHGFLNDEAASSEPVNDEVNWGKPAEKAFGALLAGKEGIERETVPLTHYPTESASPAGKGESAGCEPAAAVTPEARTAVKSESDKSGYKREETYPPPCKRVADDTWHHRGDFIVYSCRPDELQRRYSASVRLHVAKEDLKSIVERGYIDWGKNLMYLDHGEDLNQFLNCIRTKKPCYCDPGLSWVSDSRREGPVWVRITPNTVMVHVSYFHRDDVKASLSAFVAELTNREWGHSQVEVGGREYEFMQGGIEAGSSQSGYVYGEAKIINLGQSHTIDCPAQQGGERKPDGRGAGQSPYSGCFPQGGGLASCTPFARGEGPASPEREKRDDWTLRSGWWSVGVEGSLTRTNQGVSSNPAANSQCPVPKEQPQRSNLQPRNPPCLRSMPTVHGMEVDCESLEIFDVHGGDGKSETHDVDMISTEDVWGDGKNFREAPPAAEHCGTRQTADERIVSNVNGELHGGRHTSGDESKSSKTQPRSAQTTTVQTAAIQTTYAPASPERRAARNESCWFALSHACAASMSGPMPGRMDFQQCDPESLSFSDRITEAMIGSLSKINSIHNDTTFCLRKGSSDLSMGIDPDVCRCQQCRYIESHFNARRGRHCLDGPTGDQEMVGARRYSSMHVSNIYGKEDVGITFIIGELDTDKIVAAARDATLEHALGDETAGGMIIDADASQSSRVWKTSTGNLDSEHGVEISSDESMSDAVSTKFDSAASSAGQSSLTSAATSLQATPIFPPKEIHGSPEMRSAASSVVSAAGCVVIPQPDFPAGSPLSPPGSMITLAPLKETDEPPPKVPHDSEMTSPRVSRQTLLARTQGIRMSPGMPASRGGSKKGNSLIQRASTQHNSSKHSVQEGVATSQSVDSSHFLLTRIPSIGVTGEAHPQYVRNFMVQLLEELKVTRFGDDQYSTINNNCQHFSDVLVNRLKPYMRDKKTQPLL